jgi:poly-gamma-glutamate synthesis protein (capsule biosynthesis protein)
LPQELRKSIQLPPGWETAPDGANNDLSLGVVSSPAGGTTTWVYALVAPFPTVSDELDYDSLVKFWSTDAPTDPELPFTSLLVDPSTAAVMDHKIGPHGTGVKIRPASHILDAAWKSKTIWAIVPFELLEPRWKVIALAGQSPLQKSFNPQRYPLTVYFGLSGDSSLRDLLLQSSPLAKTNRDPDHLTTVMLTGVTALVRGTASLMEGRGLTYPAQDIGPWLREADILHISNEVAFAKNCPPPFDWKDLVFCSRPKYIELLEDVGADVIELTGDHFQDWGPEATLYTLEMYKERGWPYYGGGANSIEAAQAVKLEHHGNRIAFLGCNAKSEGYALASETTPGALHCNFEQLVEDVRKLRAEGYLPIVTFQHLEYYSYQIHPILQKDFNRVADAGAVIVSGSQAHQPHGFEITHDAFLHYGLGNLFFDQTNQGDAPRTAFIDRHIIYNGRHISTELLTIYLVDYARSRPMTQPERQALLEAVFKASGW